MSPNSLPLLIVKGVTDIAVLSAVLLAYRWIRRRSPWLGGVFAAGLLIRAVVGVTLFAISYFHWPILAGLQSGGGFWTLAIDARLYLGESARAAVQGVVTISNGMPSPAYLRALAIWMELFGASPASAVLMNLACFTVAGLLIVAVSRNGKVVALVALAALSFSPALVIFSTQALKDAFCAMILALLIAGLWIWCGWIQHAGKRLVPRALVGAFVMAAAVYELAGVRAYLAVFVIAATVATGFLSLAWAIRPRLQVGASYLLLVLLLCIAFRLGAPDYFAGYRTEAIDAFRGRKTFIAALDDARSGFVRLGGETSIAVQARPAPTTVVARLQRLAAGGVAVFVPISLARALSFVDFNGGRGLLFITDIDTAWMDLFLIAGLYLTFRRCVGPCWIR